MGIIGGLIIMGWIGWMLASLDEPSWFLPTLAEGVVGFPWKKLGLCLCALALVLFVSAMLMRLH